MVPRLEQTVEPEGGFAQVEQMVSHCGLEGFPHKANDEPARANPKG